MKGTILGTVAVIGFAGMAYSGEVTITGDSITVVNEAGEVVAEGDATIVIKGDGQIAFKGDDEVASDSDQTADADTTDAEAVSEAGGTEVAESATETEGDLSAMEIPVNADVAAGGEEYQGVCRNCHGPKAQGIASYPRLSDMEFSDVVGRLETYRAGEKVGPNSMLMIPHARPLSDEEIINIAAYITTAFD